MNGPPALLALPQEEIVNLPTFDVMGGRVATCFAARNPDKLTRVRIA
jgi:hypothetical protein